MSEHHGCGSGGGGCCGKQKPAGPSFPLPPHPLSQIKTVIGVAGGKGGTGKSLVTALLATALAKQGLQIAVLDADISAPAIHRMIYLPQGITKGEAGLYPAISDQGIKVMSISHFLDDATESVTFRGAVMSGILQKFWSDAIWDQVDCLLIDLPPGMGDVSHAVLERLPLDGVLMVTTPQELANQAAERTILLALEKQIPILGLIENFHGLFPGAGTAALAARYRIPMLDQLRFDASLAETAEAGQLESHDGVYLPQATALISAL